MPAKNSVEKIDSTTKSYDGASAKKNGKTGKKMKVAENQSKLSFFTKPSPTATKTTRQSKRQKTGE